MRTDLYPHQREIIERLKADGKLWTGDAFVSMPRLPGRATIKAALAGHGALITRPALSTPDTRTDRNPSAPVRRTGVDKRVIDHIDADGVITFAEPKPVAEQATDEWAKAYASTDAFSQEPTIDADRSADWNRKAKTVKPGSFAARRMAAEE